MNTSALETRFVHESPEQDINRPKRLRIVAACDNCRSRKVKCDKRDHEQCQACFEARLACTFRDKERYYAEKGRPASRASHSSGHSHHSSSASHYSSGGSHSSSSSNSRKHSPGHSSSSTSSGRSPKQDASPTLRMDLPRGMTADAQQYELTQAGASYGSSANQAYHYPAQAYYTHPTAPHDTYGSAGAQYYSNGVTSSGYAAPALTSPSQTAYTPLFDPRVTTSPHPTLMQPLINAFFGYLGSANAFISSNDVAQKFTAGQLSPVLANAIAAAAVPYADGLTLATGHDSATIAQAYSNNAKMILEKRRNDSSLSTLYAAIIIAWSEITIDSSFQYYSGLALEIAQRLRINDDIGRAALTGGSQTQLTRLRAAWANITSMFPSGSFPA